MPRPHADPCIKLALRILFMAVVTWKRNKVKHDLLQMLDPQNMPYWLQVERDELLAFFHSEWFNFLLLSSTTQIDKGKMFRVLGIPIQEVSGR